MGAMSAIIRSFFVRPVVGKKYVFDEFEDDPFLTKKRITAEVLEIKSGYVKYKAAMEGLGGWEEIRSMKAASFMFAYKPRQ